MAKNNSGVRAGVDNNDTVQYSAEADRNLTALRKEPISVAQLGLVRRRYGGVSTATRSYKRLLFTEHSQGITELSLAANHNRP